MPGNDVSAELSALRESVLEAVASFFHESDLRVEFTLLSEMRTGDYHPLHADNERRDNNGRWVPNHTPSRTHAAMLYLNTCNDDYVGGVLRFPSVPQEIAPRRAQLVAFPCTHDYEHEVTLIEQGRRYALAIWMTDAIESMEEWA